ncbi:MAG: hypothetical protein AAFV93_04595 [Chloroflexota bacterium]
MASSDLPNREQRSDYMEQWYKTEKSLFRVAGVVLLFVAGIITALDQPGDIYTATAIASSLAGSITLLSLRRQARHDRTKLIFLKEQQQRTRGFFAGGIGVLMFTQLGMRPLAWIVGGLFGVVAVWYQWRAYKVRQFNTLFEHDTEGDEAE